MTLIDCLEEPFQELSRRSSTRTYAAHTTIRFSWILRLYMQLRESKGMMLKSQMPGSRVLILFSMYKTATEMGCNGGFWFFSTHSVSDEEDEKKVFCLLICFLAVQCWLNMPAAAAAAIKRIAGSVCVWIRLMLIRRALGWVGLVWQAASCQSHGCSCDFSESCS